MDTSPILKKLIQKRLDYIETQKEKLYAQYAKNRGNQKIINKVEFLTRIEALFKEDLRKGIIPVPLELLTEDFEIYPDLEEFLNRPYVFPHAYVH